MERTTFGGSAGLNHTNEENRAQRKVVRAEMCLEMKNRPVMSGFVYIYGV